MNFILKCRSITTDTVTTVALSICTTYQRCVYGGRSENGLYHVLFPEAEYRRQLAFAVRIHNLVYKNFLQNLCRFLWLYAAWKREPAFLVSASPVECGWAMFSPCWQPWAFVGEKMQSNGASPRLYVGWGGFMMVSVPKLVDSLSVVTQEKGAWSVFVSHSVCLAVESVQSSDTVAIYSFHVSGITCVSRLDLDGCCMWPVVMIWCNCRMWLCCRWSFCKVYSLLLLHQPLGTLSALCLRALLYFAHPWHLAEKSHARQER